MSRAILISDSDIFYREVMDKLLLMGYEGESFEESALNYADQKAFFVVDMDSMGIGYGEFQQFIREYDIPVIAMSGIPRFDQAVHLLKIGIKGYVNRYTAPLNLNNAIQSILDGGMWFDPGVMQDLITQLTVSESIHEYDDVGLSEREQQIATYVAQGISNQEIAIQLNISQRTVKAHILACYQKIGAHDRVSLALWAKKVLNV